MAMELSHVWLGRFDSEAALDEYFDEQYEDDDAPINAFAADQDEMYYDHDWVEREFHESGDLLTLMDGASYAGDYLENVIHKAGGMGITNANTYILADAGQFSKPKSVNGREYQLWYIGSYNCNV